MNKPRIWVLYHFMHPDHVVSAQLYDELARSLHENGWEVIAWPCNRAYHNPNDQYVPQEHWQEVKYERLWRPGFSQHSTLGRFMNSVWMITRWSLLRLKNQQPDVILIGTDPAFGALAVLGLKAFGSRTQMVHWCFDMYPEVPVAQGMLLEQSNLVCSLKNIMKRAYRHFDLISDIGPCMRERFETYFLPKPTVTLTPWALSETEKLPTSDPIVRRNLFGKTYLGLLYSGSLGMAHSYQPFLQLARQMRDASVKFHFSMSGPRAREFRESLLQEDCNIGCSDPVTADLLEPHLAAADIHLVSLRPDWEGIVVPSKFFASLAMGRPVLFAGPERSSIARWIRQYNIGWHLDFSNSNEIIRILRELSQNPDRLHSMQQRCFEVYQTNFSKVLMLKRWNIELRGLLSKPE